MILLLTFILGVTLYFLVWSLIFNRHQFLKPFRYRTTLSRYERKKFERDFQLFLIDLIRLIQAGIPLNDALTIAAEDNGELVKEAILMPLRRIAYGEKPDEAWTKATEHFDSPRFDHFVLMLQVQQQVGGKIAEMLDRLVEMIRAKDQLSIKLKALTAEGRLSGIIIGALPPGLLGMLYLLSPLYVNEFLAHSAAFPLLGLSAVLWGVGVYFLIKLNRGLNG